MIDYLSENLWLTIKTSSQKRKSTMIVVTPYIGTNIKENIELRKGDKLITCVTKENVANGNLNPKTILQIMKKGISIYSVKNLHSKIYYFHDSVIVCSANLSENSLNYLHESGIFTNNTNLLYSIKKELTCLQEEEITREYLKTLIKYYKPKTNIKKKEKETILTSDIWITESEETEFTKDEDKELKKTETEYNEKLPNKKLYEILDLRYDANNAFVNKVEEGDRIIEIFKKGSRYFVTRPMKILGIQNGPEIDEEIEVKFIRIERKKNWKNVRRHLLNKELLNKGLNKIEHEVERKLDNSEKIVLNEVLITINNKC